VRRIAVVAHAPEAVSRLERIAAENGVEIVDERPDLAVTLGGDGSMLKAFHRFLGTGVPVIGVNFGRVGFLTSMAAGDLEQGLERAFAGEYVVVELPTLEVRLGSESWPAVNDVVVASSTLGHMVELAYAVGGEELDTLPCDGLICCTPSGSTAYNLSNGGPVLVWGLDAMALTFVAAHSLHARPLVIPRSRALAVWNRTEDGDATLIVDGKQVGEVHPGNRIDVELGDQKSLLATLPESTFFTRYRDTFTS
jgi:NAD+ kinase